MQLRPWLFFDAFGTLIHLDRVFERLQANLTALGHPLPLPDVEYAARQEFRYYIPRSRTGRDPNSLAKLRCECAEVILDGLRERGHALPLSPEQVVQALVDSLEFRLYPDVLPSLTALRRQGHHLGMISNWDYTLNEIVHRIGLGELLEVVAVSADCGCDKPEPGIFREALRRAGAAPHESLHVGDSYENDVLGARGAGMDAVLIDRRSGTAAPPDVLVIGTLGELVA